MEINLKVPSLLLCISLCLLLHEVNNSLVRQPKPAFQTVQVQEIPKLEAGSRKPPFYKFRHKQEVRARAYVLAGLQYSQHDLDLGFQNPGKVSTGRSEKKKLVCYYNVPTMYDQPFPVFPEQIEPDLCTHVNLAFARVYNLTIVPNELRDLEFYSRTIKLKLRNPELKVLLSVGGAGGGIGSDPDLGMEAMMSTNLTRARFIDNAAEFLGSYGFDGLDLDWEFPAFPGPLEQKAQLTDFLTEFKSSPVSAKLLLTAAVPAVKYIVDIGYDVPGIARSVDFVNLMTYDFHYYSWLNPVTGPLSPLANLTMEMGFMSTLNTAWAAKYWYQAGMPANKIVIGLPTYGRTFKLVDERYHGYYDLAEGIGSIGSGGYVSQVQICDFMASNGTTGVFDPDAREPYAYNGRDWVSFDNEEAAKAKAQFVKEMDFGGVMVYSVNSDDAWQACMKSTTTFPIIRTLKNTLVS